MLVLLPDVTMMLHDYTVALTLFPGPASSSMRLSAIYQVFLLGTFHLLDLFRNLS